MSSTQTIFHTPPNITSHPLLKKVKPMPIIFLSDGGEVGDNIWVEGNKIEDQD